MSLCPRTEGLSLTSIFLCPFIIRSLGIFSSRVINERPFFDDFWGQIPRLLRRWETPQIDAFIPCKKIFCLFILVVLSYLLVFFHLFCN